jgi:branched-subunit amino acid transport protein
MSPLEVWIVIVGMTLVTFATRNFFIAFGDSLRLPERVQHALRYAPVCALAALIGPEVLAPGGTIQLLQPKFFAALAAIAVVLWTRNMLLTMLVGMAVFTALRLW